MAVGKEWNRIKSVPAWDGLTQLALLAACFAAGALGGLIFSGWSGDNPELLDRLRRFFQAAGQGRGTAPSLWATAWELARWPLAALLLGFTAFGALGLPLLLSARGFLLAYAAATLARLFGLPGMAASFAAFGVTAFMATPVFFVVSVNAFRQSLCQLSGQRIPAWGQRLQVLTPCAGLLVLAAALQQTLMPALLAAVCARLFCT